MKYHNIFNLKLGRSLGLVLFIIYSLKSLFDLIDLFSVLEFYFALLKIDPFRSF